MTTTKDNTIKGKSSTADRAEVLEQGTTKHFPNDTQQLTFGGVTYTVKDVKANLQEIADLRSATTDAQTNAKAKVAAEKAKLPALRIFLSAYVAYLKATYGNTPDVLADFGIVPRKARKPVSPETAAAAKAKREATRKARGTKGSVEKKAIVGNVTGVIVTPVTAPAAAPSPATPPVATAPAAPGAPATVSPTAAAGTTPHS
jgi:hypothetical protein